ncbi:MAG: type IV toxin-antitoxin system AbiEi family antitoxin [Sneathiella sp.]
MNTEKGKILNNLLQSAPLNAVWLASWLASNGVSHSLQNRYVQSGWLEKLGSGAYKRTGASVNWLGCVYALQKQTHKPVHVGGLTALHLKGHAHYLRSTETRQLFAPTSYKQPAWLKNNTWLNDKIELHCTSFLGDVDKSLLEYEDQQLSITIASPERAILETLYLCPKHADLVETYQTFEGLVNLRPKLVQALLEASNSVKVNRLFCFMADKANHQWWSFVSKANINLGNGKRSIEPGGVFEPQYQITIPKELAAL